MKITLITLNYNSSKETARLLESLKNRSDTNFEIIVIDNASEETDFNSLTMLNTVNLQVLRNSENLGFSGGNNVGIRQALQNGSEWIVLLNNDIWVEEDFIKRLRAKLSASKGILGLPLNEGGRTAYCGKIEWLKPTLKHVYDVKEISSFQTINDKPKTKNYYVIGGGMAIHKNIFEKIGLLDEKYFLYFEDADFSIRAGKAGFDISIADNCMIYHTVSATTKKLGSPLLLRYHYRNALCFNLKNGPWYIKLLVWPWSWVIAIKQVVKTAMKQNPGESEAILAGVVDFYRNRMGRVVDF